MTDRSEPAAAQPRAAAAALPTSGGRRRRWLAGLGLGIVVLAAAWLWLLPPWVEATLRSRLQQAGFTAVAIGSVEVRWNRLVVRDLRLGAAQLGTGHVTVAAATASFTLADLLARRIDALVLDLPIWTMGPASVPATSPVAGVLPRDDGGAPGSRERVLPILPMRSVAIRGGRITPLPGRAFGAVSIDATLAIVGEQWGIDVEAAADLQRVTARLQVQEPADGGVRGAAGTVELRVHGAHPLDFAGTCGLAATAAGRSLALDLQRRPGAFEVVVAGTTCSGEGDFELHAQVPFAAPDAAVFAARFGDLDLASAAGMQLHGLAADLHLHGLPTPTSVGSQQVTWRSAQLAAVPLGSGDATFELRPGLELELRLRQRTVDEVGSIDVRELRLVPGMRSSPVTMVFDLVPLQGCLELLSRGRITGEGRLSGSLELVAQIEPRPAVDLRAGRLVAAPGGFVRFLDDPDTEALLRQHVEQIALASGHESLVQERLVAALQEFAYTALEFGIDAAGEGVTLRVHAAGVGRKVPQQLDLDINLHGFDAAVDAAIAVKLGLDRMQQNLTDTIDNQPPAIRVQRKP